MTLEKLLRKERNLP